MHDRKFAYFDILFYFILVLEISTYYFIKNHIYTYMLYQIKSFFYSPLQIQELDGAIFYEIVCTI